MQRQPGLCQLGFILLFLGIVSGCSGTGSTSSSSSSSSSSSNSSSSSGITSSSSSSSSSSSGAGVTCITNGLPPTVLRRLTRFEYENSVRDLLNVDTAAVRELPADEADGFDNNAELQGAPDYLVEKYVVVSETLAALAVRNLSSLTANCATATTGERACAQQFARKFGRKAFRRALTSADETQLMNAYDAGASGGTYAEGIEVMIRMALQSPNFLYRLEVGPANNSNQLLIPLNSFEAATRLSYFLWGTGPDDALLDVAAAGKLATKAQIAAKAREMLASPKAKVALTNFMEQWTGVRKLDTLTRNTTLFPNYSSALRDAMKREMPAFVDYLFTKNELTLQQLFTANVAFVSGPLADIYGVARPAGSDTTAKIATPPSEQGRAGFLTQAGFLAVKGHPDQTSPVLRGKFVRANLLCDPPPPPPDNVDISVPELSEGVTARDRASIHLQAGNGCSGCHKRMDPIGLAFEHFDAMGQFRTAEGGQTIDVSGEVLYSQDTALAGAFMGVKPLAQKLAVSSEVQQCVAAQIFRFAAGRYEAEDDACSLNSMQSAFKAANGNLIELMVAMTQTDAFLYRTQEAK